MIPILKKSMQQINGRGTKWGPDTKDIHYTMVNRHDLVQHKAMIYQVYILHCVGIRHKYLLHRDMIKKPSEKIWSVVQFKKSPYVHSIDAYVMWHAGCKR